MSGISTLKSIIIYIHWIQPKHTYELIFDVKNLTTSLTDVASSTLCVTISTKKDAKDYSFAEIAEVDIVVVYSNLYNRPTACHLIPHAPSPHGWWTCPQSKILDMPVPCKTCVIRSIDDYKCNAGVTPPSHSTEQYVSCTVSTHNSQV